MANFIFCAVFNFFTILLVSLVIEEKKKLFLSKKEPTSIEYICTNI